MFLKNAQYSPNYTPYANTTPYSKLRFSGITYEWYYEAWLPFPIVLAYCRLPCLRMTNYFRISITTIFITAASFLVSLTDQWDTAKSRVPKPQSPARSNEDSWQKCCPVLYEIFWVGNWDRSRDIEHLYPSTITHTNISRQIGEKQSVNPIRHLWQFEHDRVTKVFLSPKPPSAIPCSILI